MSRDNPQIQRTVAGSLIGEKNNYNVKIVLTLMEIWGHSTMPDDVVIMNEKLSPITALAIEDGDYLMQYSLGGKDFEKKVRIMSEILVSAA